jgi:hypothetical protein
MCNTATITEDGLGVSVGECPRPPSVAWSYSRHYSARSISTILGHASLGPAQNQGLSHRRYSARCGRPLLRVILRRFLRDIETRPYEVQSSLLHFEISAAFNQQNCSSVLPKRCCRDKGPGAVLGISFIQVRACWEMFPDRFDVSSDCSNPQGCIRRGEGSRWSHSF